jgi:predicted dehydrogenase
MLKIGIFGAGHLGKFHLNNWKEIQDVQLIGFYDPDQERSEIIAREYGLKNYPDAESLVNEVDAVDIVAPTTAHFQLCELAVKNGKHVFVEKPMCDHLDEARTLVKLVKEAGVKFQVGHVERFNPAFLAIQNLDLKPMFIEVHRLAQFNPRGTEVSVVLDLMIHDIDIILHLVKSEVRQVMANGVSVMTDTPDIANVRIEFDNGCVANLTSSRISMKKMRKMRLFQRDAYIGVDFLEKKAEIIRMKEQTEENEISFEINTPNGQKPISIIQPVINTTNAIKEELQSFVNSIINNHLTAVSEVDGLRAMEVAHLILQKIQRTGIN